MTEISAKPLESHDAQSPPSYAGPIRVVYINEFSWMEAGDMGTIRKTVAALAPVEASVEMSLDATCVEGAFAEERVSHITKSICTQWRQAAAEVLNPVTQDNPQHTPVVFISTGQIGLRRAYSVLRDIVGGTNVWLDVCADMPMYKADDPAFPVGPTMINAFVDERKWTNYQYIESSGHKRILLPYLPELRGLPSRDEASARLAECYHVEFKRPLMAVLIGQSVEKAQQVTDAARALSADLLVITSPRSHRGENYPDNQEKWRKNSLVFHEFGKSSEPNPYADFIAVADYFAVDGDSMSMPADVLAQGKPVALFGSMDRFKYRLVANDLVTALTGADTKWHPPPPHEMPGAMLNRVVRTELANLVGGGP